MEGGRHGCNLKQNSQESFPETRYLSKGQKEVTEEP